MADSTTRHEGQTRVGRLAARALLKVLDGLRSGETRAGDGQGRRSVSIDVGEPGGDLSEEELLVLTELAEEQEDPFIPPPRPCRALRRNRAWRPRRLTTTR
jgi:hypothetical protein